MAATVPPLVYAGVAGMVRKSDVSAILCVALHLVPTIGIVIILVLWRAAIDFAIALIFSGYAVAILLLSAAMDVVSDFAWTKGDHAPRLVTIANLAVMAVLSCAVATAGRRGKPDPPAGPGP